jgi:hypothetical protein
VNKVRFIFIVVLFSIRNYSIAQVGIGTNTPNANAKLEVVSTNQGVLVPRVNLTSKTLDLNADGDNNVSNQPIGLLVYNTGTVLVKGFCYWTGTEWRVLVNSSAELASATLSCSEATLDPQQQIANPTAITAGTTMKVPYILGNGGNFTGVTLTSTGNSNVTATISSGKLETGSGYLIFNVSGTPTTAQNSPTGISFDLTPFKTANPSISLSPSNGVVTVGTQTEAKVVTTAVMDYLKPVSPDGYAVSLNTPDGKFSIRVFLDHTGGTWPAGNTTQVQYANVQIRSIGATRTIMWNQFGGYGGGNNTSTAASGGSLQIPANTWGGSLNNTFNAGFNWADAGIYQGANSGPEFRFYSWITQGASEKTAYIATIMAGTNGAITSADYTTMKVFIKIEQIISP